MQIFSEASFHYTGTDFQGELRIPLDISYSDSLARLTIYLHDERSDVIGVVNSIKLEGGNDILDNQGPNITFETQNGQRLEKMIT